MKVTNKWKLLIQYLYELFIHGYSLKSKYNFQIDDILHNNNM